MADDIERTDAEADVLADVVARIDWPAGRKREEFERVDTAFAPGNPP